MRTTKTVIWQAATMELNLPLEDSAEALDECGPIFIIGCPRSGTTFLSSMVAALDDTELFNAGLAPARIIHLIAGLDDDALRYNLLLCMRDSFWGAFWRRVLFRDRRLMEVYRGNTSILNLFQKGHVSKTLLAYQEPFAAFAAVEMAKHFARSKFIHMIRDGRDNADSFERTYPHALSDDVLRSPRLATNKASEIGVWRSRDGWVIPWWIREDEEEAFIEGSRFERCLMLWKEMVGRARLLRAPEFSGRYLEVRYERLVGRPLETAGDVAAHVGRPLNRRARRRLKRARQTSIGIAKRNQPSDRIDAAEKVAGALLRELGYG